MAKAKPLDTYLGFNEYIFEQSEKTWLVCKPNKEGNYAYKEDSFNLEAVTLGGLIVGENHWLIAVLPEKAIENEGIADIYYRKKDGDKWVPEKEKNENSKKRWITDGCLIAINCNEIASLKILSKVLAQLTMFVTAPSPLKCFFKLEDDASKKLEIQLSEFLASDLVTEILDDTSVAYSIGLQLMEQEFLPRAIKSVAEIPSDIKTNPLTKASTKVARIFPYSGEIPSGSTPTFTPPEPPAKKSGWSSGSNVSVVNNGYLSPDDRLAFCIKCLKQAGVDVPSEDFGGLVKTLEANANALKYYKLALGLTSNSGSLDA